MKAYVINLERSPERKIYMQKLLKKFPFLDVEFVTAVDGRAMNENERIHQFDVDKFYARYSVMPRPGEIGCTLSHQKCYCKMVKEGIPCALILEDDIVEPDNITLILEILGRLMSKKEPQIILVSGWFWYYSTTVLSTNYKLAKVYDAFLAEGRRKCEILKSGSHELSKFEILSALLRLRQVCCHPDLIPGTLRPDADQPVRSAKMELLKELLLETIDSGHKVLLFSQFTSLLSIVRAWLDSESIRYEYLDGATTDRMAHVDNFNNSPDIPLFLLSLKAGGLGLNLTSADTVIIYDPWWNPAAEAQAADRTHRIGQTKSVNCIKLLVKNSIEEKVLELQKMKAGLFNNLVEAPSEAMRGMSMEDFEFLLKD